MHGRWCAHPHQRHIASGHLPRHDNEVGPRQHTESQQGQHHEPSVLQQDLFNITVVQFGRGRGWIGLDHIEIKGQTAIWPALPSWFQITSRVIGQRLILHCRFIRVSHAIIVKSKEAKRTVFLAVVNPNITNALDRA